MRKILGKLNASKNNKNYAQTVITEGNDPSQVILPCIRNPVWCSDRLWACPDVFL